MAVFTSANKTAIQGLYTKVKTAIEARYGDAELESMQFGLGEDGKINSLKVDVGVLTPPDVDGDTVRVRKSVEMWQ